VGSHNTLALLKAGANVLVAGNSIFAAEDPAEEIAALKRMSVSQITA
jgi:ribulose-phosphate 3-epimerase